MIKPKFELGQLVNLKRGLVVPFDFEFNPYKIISISLDEGTNKIYYSVRAFEDREGIVSLYDEFCLEELPLN